MSLAGVRGLVLRAGNASLARRSPRSFVCLRVRVRTCALLAGVSSRTAGCGPLDPNKRSPSLDRRPPALPCHTTRVRAVPDGLLEQRMHPSTDLHL